MNSNIDLGAVAKVDQNLFHHELFNNSHCVYQRATILSHPKPNFNS